MKSLWQNIDTPAFPELKKDEKAEVVIAGGGITGLLTAYHLNKQGKQVVLVEADRLASGTTGHTTAKITAQHGDRYQSLLHHSGNDVARLYYDAQVDGIREIQAIIHEEQISCEWEVTEAHLFAETEKGKEKLRLEQRAYKQLDIPFSSGENTLTMPDQAQFHPLLFLKEIASLLTERGVIIYENTPVTKVKEDELEVGTGHTIRFDHFVSATHFPIFDPFRLLAARTHPERSYVVAVKPQSDFPEGYYLSLDDTVRSIRTSGDHLIIAGENHRPGEGKDPSFHYDALIAYAKENYGAEEVTAMWSAHDHMTSDNLPFIGQMRNNCYVATGFGKWGMTNSVVAAKVITNKILGEKDEYAHIFRPSRFAISKDFFKNATNVATHFIEGKVELVDKRAERLEKDEGSVVQWRGQRIGAYKDEEGSLHLVDTTCTHMGCEVEWNSAEKSWDCPCHGSRFTIDGEIMEGPAQENLPLIAEEEMAFFIEHEIDKNEQPPKQ